MNCDEIRRLNGPYQDSELDARTTLEVREHLQSCGECARIFALEEQLDARLAAALQTGQKTPALWEELEHRAVAGFRERERESGSTVTPSRLEATVSWWRGILWPSPYFYAGLTAVWLVMLAVSLATSDQTAEEDNAKAAPEVLRALRQQRHELAEFLATSDEKEKTTGRRSPAPRSEGPLRQRVA